MKFLQQIKNKVQLLYLDMQFIVVEMHKIKQKNIYKWQEIQFKLIQFIH